VHHLFVMHMQDSVVDQLHELIFEYLNIHAHTIGFPELALPILMEVCATLLAILMLHYCVASLLFYLI